MAISLSIFFYLFLIYIFLFCLFSFFNIYHLLRFATPHLVVYIVMLIYVAGSIGILAVSFFFLQNIDWSQSIQIAPFMNYPATS